jgi:hypothetical protein
MRPWKRNTHKIMLTLLVGLVSLAIVAVACSTAEPEAPLSLRLLLLRRLPPLLRPRPGPLLRRPRRRLLRRPRRPPLLRSRRRPSTLGQ